MAFAGPGTLQRRRLTTDATDKTDKKTLFLSNLSVKSVLSVVSYFAIREDADAKRACVRSHDSGGVSSGTAVKRYGG
jgi:hypothetical protein